MRLYFKNRNSPKAYKVVITALNDSHLGFIGEITNPTMKIGNGVVQFYLAPIAAQGTWNIEEDYHYANGKLTLLASKTLKHTSYNSHATHSDFTKNIQLALEQTEFHGFEIIRTAVRDLTNLSDADWMYDAENKKILYFNVSNSGSLTLQQVAAKINSYTTSVIPLNKANADLLIKDVIADLFKTQSRGLLKPSEFNAIFINNAVITELGTEVYPDTSLNSLTTSSLNFNQGLVDRIPDTVWYAEGNATVVVGGEAFSNNALKTTKDISDSLKSSTQLFKGGQTPFTMSFDFLIKEDQNDLLNLPLFSKNTNASNGDQILYISNNRLIFERRAAVVGTALAPVTGLHRIEYNTKYSIKFLYDGNMLKCFINDELDFKVGSSIGLHTGSSEPYRFLNSLVPVYNSFRSVTNGYIDNLQIDDGIARDHTKVIDPYVSNLVAKLSFQGQAAKTIFVDEAKPTTTWTGYGDAKLAVENTYSNYSYLSLNGMSSYLLLENANHLAFTGTKFSIRIEFKTSTTSKRQVLFDRFENDIGAYQISVNSDGKIYFTILPSAAYVFFESVVSNLNDGIRHSVDIIKEGNSLLIYVDDLLDSMHDVTGIKFDYKASKTAIGAQVLRRNELYDFNGNIYNVAIYDGVAVYPNLVPKQLDKVELNFDKQTIEDLYGNTSWTNNGVTFDQVNSVKGYAAKFNGSSSKITSTTQSLNFEDKSFLVELDVKRLKESENYSALLSNGANNSIYHTGYIGFSYNSYNISSLCYNNVFYNVRLSKKMGNTILKINDVCIGSINGLSNVDFSTAMIGTGVNSNNYFNGYIDNFKTIKNYQGGVVVDRPAVHLPLETNTINTGFAGLTVNSIGNPTYTQIKDKKCVKFVNTNSCLQIKSNNIFNINLKSTDVYIELDVYFEKKDADGYCAIFHNRTNYSNQSYGLLRNYNSENITFETSYGTSLYEHLPVPFPNTIMNEWVNIKIYSKNGTLNLLVNDTFHNSKELLYDTRISSSNINFARLEDTDNNVDGIISISNFKMFIGISELPATYDERKVLDLDFKPTYKSYLFKDNNNKCIIHPVNIKQRNYEDGEYCLKLNGVDQYLQLGKNEALNFDKDDFIINTKFSVASLSSSYRYILTGGSTSDVSGRCYLAIDAYNRICFGILNGSHIQLVSTFYIEAETVYDVTIQRVSDKVYLHINKVLNNSHTFGNIVFNFNENYNTMVGRVNFTNVFEGFPGTIYSIKILRNTSDLTLLDDILPEPEPPETTEDSGVPPLEKGVLNFWQLRQEIDPRNVVLEFNQLRLE